MWISKALEMLTVVCISWCQGVALSQQSTHAREYPEEQQVEHNRDQVHFSRIANSQLDELQLLPTLTTEVYLNGVQLGEPLFTEEELTLAMTRTKVNSWVEGRWRLFHILDSASQSPSKSSAMYRKYEICRREKYHLFFPFPSHVGSKGLG